MLSLMNRAFEPSASFQDKITFLTAVHQTQSVHSDTGVITAEKIQDLLTSSSTRLLGLQLLETALQQNPDIYLKGRWVIVLSDVLKDSNSTILKRYACRIFCAIIPYMVKDPASNKMDLHRFAENLLHHVLDGIADDCEWFEGACKVVCLCARYFPQVVAKFKVSLSELFCKHLTQSVSSKTFELVGEMYSQLPNCVQSSDPKVYASCWLHHYSKIFYSMQHILNTFLTFLSDDPYGDENVKSRYKDYSMFENEAPAADVYEEYTRGVRRYINLCKCLAKMLSIKTRFAVEIPVKLTIRGLTRLFQIQDIAKIKTNTVEMQVLCSSLSQMQIASLLVLESLIVNFDLVPYSVLVAQVMYSALQSSKLPNTSSEPICELRLAVWTFLSKWITIYGNKVCGDIVGPTVLIVEELLKDISLDEREASQTSTIQMSAKSKKNACTSWVNKCYTNPVQRKVCKAALKTLSNLIYTGVNHISKKMFQEMFTKVSQVAATLILSCDPYPFPYDDDSCRKNLYSALLAFTVTSKPNQREPIQCSSSVFKKALRDPSVKVTSFCYQAMAIVRLSLHPKRPPVELRDSGKQNCTSEIPRFPQWSTEDFVPNLHVENMSNVPPDNVNCRISRNYHHPNESAMERDEAMDEDIEESHYSEHAYQEYSEPYMSKYPEQVSGSQRNGEDVLEIRNSSECQEDVDSEDEDEEDEEDRSYCDEEINEGDMPAENMCLPSTSKAQVVNPVHIIEETVAINLEDPDYESTKQCSKLESSIECNKNKHLNGIRNLVPHEDAPSTSRQCLANENGLDNSEEEECEEEEFVEDEEENVSFPAEKKTPECYSSAPPSKKQKIENDEGKDNPPDKGRSSSPTLQEMIASFRCDLATPENKGD